MEQGEKSSAVRVGMRWGGIGGVVAFPVALPGWMRSALSSLPGGTILSR